MEVRIPKRTFVNLLTVVERVIPNRNSNPILTYLYFSAKSGVVSLMGANTEIDIAVTASAEVLGEGTILIPTSTFSQLVRAAPADLIELTLKDGNLEFASGVSKATLATITPDGYPELLFYDKDPITMGATELAGVLSKVLYAASNEQHRAIFRGIQLEFSAEEVRAVASDGFRLVMAKTTGVSADIPSGDMRILVIPQPSVRELLRVLTTGMVKLSVVNGCLSVIGSGVSISIKLMEGSFPNYQNVIPQSFVTTVEVSANQLREAIQRTMVLSDKENRRVNLFVDEGEISLSSEGDFGKASERVACDVMGQRQMLVACRGQYLIDALEKAEERVKIELSGITSPMKLTTLPESGYTAIVVPLRV